MPIWKYIHKYIYNEYSWYMIYYSISNIYIKIIIYIKYENLSKLIRFINLYVK